MENTQVDGSKEKTTMENDVETTKKSKLSAIKMVASRVKNFFIKVYGVCKSLGGLIVLLVIYNVLGALLFQVIEAPKELEVKEELNKTREEFLFKFYSEAKIFSVDYATYNQTWFNHTLKLLTEYETEVRALGAIAGPDTVWTFWSALFFCGTIYTTIGYGNIVPLTGIGRFLVIVYAVLGIPLALLVLAEVGRRFTVLLKIIYGAVRRYYYTGTFRKKLFKNVRHRLTRKNKHSIQNIENGTQEDGSNPIIKKKSKSDESIIFVKNKKKLSSSPNSSLKSKTGSEDSLNLQDNAQSTLSSADGVKVIYDIEIDDSFNLPITVAGVILLIYILLGGIMYLFWEDWTFLESIYFVFISLATIGFGDITPAHPKYFIITSIYMFMGLALVSMCINVGIEFFTQTIDKAKERMGRAKERVVVAGKEKMAVVGKEMNKAKDKVSKAGTSAKDKITEVKKNIEFNIQNELKRAKKHSIDSSESRSKESTPKL